MFYRKGQALGSVNHKRLAELRAERPTRKNTAAERVAVLKETEGSVARTQEVYAGFFTPEPEPDGKVGRPKDYEPKGLWVEWAVTQGANEDEANELTKTQIIELFG